MYLSRFQVSLKMDNFLIQQTEKMEQHYNLDKGNQVSQI